MSSTSTPIPAHRFAEAIKELPLANLHFKATEIRNSIAHLVSSNQQLQPFVNEGDFECKEAIDENVLVVQRMEARIRLLKREVEDRGFKWGEEEEEEERENFARNGNQADHNGPVSNSVAVGTRQSTRSSGGSLSDEELARRLTLRTGEGDNADDDGVHL